MTDFCIFCAAAMSIFFSSLAVAQQEMTTTQSRRPIMTVDFAGQPFPGGLCFSADGSRLWTDRMEAWSVPDGKSLDSSKLKQLNKSRQIIDVSANDEAMLIALPKSGELLFWDQKDGVRRRVLKQTGKLAAARYIGQGKRFALVFSEPPSIYYGNVDSDEDDSIAALAAKPYKCKISPNGKLLAIQNNRDIEIWDVKRNAIRATLKHDHKLFSFAFSHDGRWFATGTANDNMVRLYNTSQGALKCELKGHTNGTIFLSSAVYSLAFSPNGKWLASGGHDGRVIVWDLENQKPLWQAQIDGPPIVCSVAFSPDSSLLAGSFENAGAKRGIRAWKISEDNN